MGTRKKVPRMSSEDSMSGIKLRSPGVRAKRFEAQAKSGSFTPGKPRVWAGIRLLHSADVSNYDPAPDGKRVAAILADQGAAVKSRLRASHFSRASSTSYGAKCQVVNSVTRP
jgi:hypothetical protein